MFCRVEMTDASEALTAFVIATCCPDEGCSKTSEMLVRQMQERQDENNDKMYRLENYCIPEEIIVK